MQPSKDVGRVILILVFAVACFCSLPLLAAEPASRDLNSGWQFRIVTGPDAARAQTELQSWHPAQVPGVVQTDLVASHLIADPFYQDNESRLQWVGESDWEYQTSFQVDAATLAREHVDLVFDGLDTFAEVFLNDHAVLQSDNMFRRYRIVAKPLLESGPNTLRIVFHSPITKMLPYVKSLPFVLPAISTQNGGNEEGIATAPYTRKAPYQYGWDWGPRFVTEGIWKGVRLEMWDTLRVENFHVRQQEITKEAAKLTADVQIQAGGVAGMASVTFSHEELGGKSVSDGTQTVQLDAGTNHVTLPIRVANPKLWYPLGYGAQDRYHFSAVVHVGKNAVAVLRSV